MMIKSVSYFSLSILFLLVLTNCKDDDDKIRFEGIVMTDASGTHLGTKGSKDLDDWEQDANLPGEILEMMDFPHSEDMSDTDYAVIEINAYPNPCAISGNVEFNVYGGPCLLKIVVVNEEFKMRYRSIHKVTGAHHSFDFSDETRFPDQSIVRVYYSFSQKDDENFYVGHGDFWICRTGNCN